ncbi:MAG: hypothetical protein JJU36_06065 [Phycisphaeraceae bacterium]|nr:hypothetical protein [Phycisphaeraceae bacterium]
MYDSALSRKPGPRVARQRRRRRLYLRLLIGALVITGSLPVFALLMMPGIHHRLMIARLSSEDDERRQRAIAYLVQRGPEDPGLVSAAAARLDGASDAVFQSIKQGLDTIGKWNRPPVSDASWIRWMESLAEYPDPVSRLFLATRIAEDIDLLSNPAFAAIWPKLAEDDDEQVRHEMIFALAARLRADPEDIDGQILLIQGIGDESAAVARDAAILTGFFKPWATGISANPARVPLPVGMAMLWSAMRTNPDQPRTAMEIAANEQLPLRMRSMAVWALSLSDDERAAGFLRDQRARLATDDHNAMPGELVWTLIRYAGRNGIDDERSVRAWLGDLIEAGSLTSGARRPIWASVHRHPELLLGDDAVARMLRDDPVAWIAGAESPWMTPDTELQPPEALLDAVRSEPWWLGRALNRQTITPADVWPLLVSPISTYRDHGCLLSVQGLTDDQLETLIRRLLLELDDAPRFSGAMLSGLTGIRPKIELDGRERDLLELRLRSARDTGRLNHVRMMQLGLWMQGEVELEDHQLGAWMLHDELPRTSVLMAMMHRGDLRAVDRLLELQHPMVIPLTALDLRSPAERRRDREAEATVDLPNAGTEDERTTLELVELLVDYRWAGVLAHFLNDDAPRPDLWTDRWLAEFQVELLRYWRLTTDRVFSDRPMDHQNDPDRASGQ